MKKYIDAEGVMRACYDSFLKTGNKAYSEIIALADAAPAADVAEVQHGRWVVKHGVLAGDGIYGDMGECSVCGLHLRNYEWDYCPNCGAKMDGDTE